MDERNERGVWDLLLNTANNYSSQYFYMAPKFPRHLEFSEKMSVAICHNGATRKRKPKFDLDAVIRRIKRKKEGERNNIL